MLKDLLLDILFPKFCIGCGREGKYVCDRCNIFTSEVEPIYFQQEKYGLDSLISVWEYEGLMKKAIHQIKYQGVADIIKELMSSVILSPQAKNFGELPQDPSLRSRIRGEGSLTFLR